MTESYRCWAEVDLNALGENLSQIRRLAGPGRKILTVVKADAYGHGLRQIAAVLMQNGTDIFGVANLAEARAIRTVGQGWPILMLGACLPSEVELAVRERIMPTVSTVAEAERFSIAATRQGACVSLHVKIDTGMGRLGTAPASAYSLLQAIDRLPRLTVDGLYTHFSSAEDDEAFTAGQREQFAALVDSLARQGRHFSWIHASNSGGLLLEPAPPCNLIRAGLLVYGIVPPGSRLNPRPSPAGPTGAGPAPGFIPALRWKCRVSLVKDVPPGTPVSYGHTYVAPSASRLAVLTAGYGDGYLRSGSNRAQVLVGGQLCPVRGRVTMDQTVVDVSGLKEVQPGDEAVLLGSQSDQQISAIDLAGWCQTIPWEILTNITYRVPRVYRGGHAS